MALKRKIVEKLAMFDSDSDSEEDVGVITLESSDTYSESSFENDLIFTKRRKLTRMKNFVEVTVPGYDNEEFKEHFRLQRATCYSLIELVQEDGVLPIHSFGRKKISSEKAVLMTVWYLSNTETFREMADRFNVTKSTAHGIINKIITYLVKTSNRFIKWPDQERKVVVRRGFQKMKGINGIIGAIDGSHINIKRPNQNSHVYCNRKSDYSILLQGVCDHEKRFIDIFCGEAGSLHDSRLLKRSSLYERCLDGFLENDVLLGDSAYPCLNWLIPPFRDTGNLTRNQRIFNYRHSATRIVIENAFGYLKGRFRRLKFFENDNINFIVRCVVASAVIHNVCIDFADEIDEATDVLQGEDHEQERVHNICGMEVNVMRRNEIMREMFEL